MYTCIEGGERNETKRNRVHSLGAISSISFLLPQFFYQLTHSPAYGSLCWIDMADKVAFRTLYKQFGSFSGSGGPAGRPASLVGFHPSIYRSESAAAAARFATTSGGLTTLLPRRGSTQVTWATVTESVRRDTMRTFTATDAVESSSLQAYCLIS